MNEIVDIKDAYLVLENKVAKIFGVDMIKTVDSPIFVASIWVKYKNGYIDFVPIAGLENLDFMMEDE